MHFTLQGLVHDVFPQNKKVREFYVSYLLKVAGMAMIGIFIPLYILSLGFSLSIVMITFLLHSLAQMTFSFPAAKFCSKYGAKKSMVLSTGLLIIFYILLLQLHNVPVLVFVIPIVYGISAAYYYIPFNALLTTGLDKGRVGKEYGTFSGLIRAAAVAGPIIGGILISVAGFATPFMIALVFLVLSLIPLLMSNDFPIKSRCSFSKEIKRFDYRYLLGFIGWGITVRSSNLWHIFIFFLLGSYVFVGGIGTLSWAVAILGTFIAGWAYDKIGLRYLFPISTVVGSVLVALRTFVSTAAQIIGLEILFSPTFISQQVAHQSTFYKAARRSKEVLPYVLMREVMIHSGIILYTGAFAIIFLFTPRIEIAFIVAAFMNLFHLFAIRKKPLRF